MRNDKTKIGTILLGIGFLWYGVFRGAKGLVIGVHSYSFKGISLTDNTASLNLNLSIKNPLLVGVTIKRIAGDVYVQGENVGHVNTVYDYYLKGGHTHVLPVIVNLNISKVGQAALLNIQSGDISNLTIGFDGSVVATNKEVEIPIRFELDYEDLTS